MANVNTPQAGMPTLIVGPDIWVGLERDLIDGLEAWLGSLTRCNLLQYAHD